MKKGIIILLISGVFILVVGALAVMGIMGLVRSNVRGMKHLEVARSNEHDRIRGLPELKAVVIAGARVQAPFSRKEVACYALIQGHRLRLSGRSTGSSGGPVHAFEDDVVLVGGPGLVLSVEGSRFDALPDSAILFWRADGSENSTWAQRIKGRTFTSNMWGGPYNPNFEEDNRAVMAMKGRSGLLDRYINRPDAYHEPDVYLEELLFQAGDTIVFKGRVEGERLVPLF